MHPNFWHWRNWTYSSIVIGLFVLITLLSGASTCIKSSIWSFTVFLPTTGDLLIITTTFIIEFIYNYRRRQLWLDYTKKVLESKK
ncbi:MAG: hypothetical protein ACRDAO_07335 [Culicoidibacterales bacterium]